MSNDPQDFKDKILLKIVDDLVVIRESQTRTEVDVKEHIKRTNILQVKVESLEKQSYMVRGAMFVVGCIFAILKYIKVV